MTTFTISRRSDGRAHDTGLIRPYRPAPHDFRETYLAIGWDGIEDHYRTNSRCIRRWIEECGGDELRAARAAVTGSTLKPSRRSSRFKPYAAPVKEKVAVEVRAKRLTAVKGRRGEG